MWNYKLYHLWLNNWIAVVIFATCCLVFMQLVQLVELLLGRIMHTVCITSNHILNIIASLWKWTSIDKAWEERDRWVKERVNRCVCRLNEWPAVWLEGVCIVIGIAYYFFFVYVRVCAHSGTRRNNAAKKLFSFDDIESNEVYWCVFSLNSSRWVAESGG